MKSFYLVLLLLMTGCAKKAIVLPKCDPPNVLKLYSDAATCSLPVATMQVPEPSPQWINGPMPVMVAVKRGEPPYINEPSLMRGARCSFADRSPTGRDWSESVFGQVKTVTLSQTVDTKHWVLTFGDFDDCTLSFWTDSGDRNKPVNVTSISSY